MKVSETHRDRKSRKMNRGINDEQKISQKKDGMDVKPLTKHSNKNIIWYSNEEKIFKIEND